MSNIIDSIRMSGTTYAISDSGGTKVVEITQSDYDNLPTSAKTANIMYVITDAEPFDVSNYYTKDETSGATELATAFAATQPKLSAGTNITIDANNVISAEGGGSITIDPSLDSGSTNAVANSAITTALNDTVKLSNLSTYYINGFTNYVNRIIPIYHRFDINNQSNGNAWWFGKINDKYVITTGQTSVTPSDLMNLQVVETSAITTSITSSSTDSQVPSAKAVYDALGGGGGGIDSGTVQTMIDQSISGKTNQTDFVSHSGNTSIHVTTAQTAAWDAKSDFSGSYNDLTDKPTIPIVPTNVSSFNNDAGYITSNDISGKTNQSDFVSHSGNTTMHVTESEKSTWNAKSDFSGNYNDLSNKPTIPTSASQLTNDSGYITSSALNGYATEAYVTAATNDMATKTWVGQQGYLTQHQDISGKQDVSGMTAYTTTATTSSLNNVVTAHTADTAIHVTAQDKTNWNAKSDFSGSYNDLTNKLSAGTNITIVDNVISAEGGGGGKAVSGGTNISITTGETADTINCTLPITATSNVFNTISVGEGSGGGTYNTLIGPNIRCDTSNGHNVFLVAQKSNSSSNGAYVNGTHNVIIGAIKDGYLNFGIQSFSTSRSVVIGGGGISTDKDNSLAIGYNANVSGTTKTNINNQLIIDTSNQVYIYNKDNTEMICLQDQLGGGGSSYTAGDGIDITNDVISVSGVVMSSAITTSVTSSSTDSQIPSAKAVNDKLGGLSIVKLTQSEYDSLATKDNSTLYVIVN